MHESYYLSQYHEQDFIWVNYIIRHFFYFFYTKRHLLHEAHKMIVSKMVLDHYALNDLEN